MTWTANMNYYNEEYCIDPIFDLSLDAQDHIENTSWPYPTRLIEEELYDDRVFFPMYD